MTSSATQVDSSLKGIAHVVLVLSGKGGVGKSTVAVELALSLLHEGKKVGILDIDVCGPSVPRMLGLNDADILQSSLGWVPVLAGPVGQLAVMSIQFFLGADKDAAVIWRGPKKIAMIKQFLGEVVWGTLDYLIVDTPPGTSDEHITITEALRDYRPDGAVIVTTPQDVATADVTREITFCQEVGLPIIGLVENMSGFVCPHCKDCINIFGKGGGEALAHGRNIPFLGAIPIDPLVASAADEGKVLSFAAAFPTSETTEALRAVVERVRRTCEKKDV